MIGGAEEGFGILAGEGFDDALDVDVAVFDEELEAELRAGGGGAGDV